MSTYNPLNDYNTYAYHHFLIIAKTTEIAENLAADASAFFEFIRSGGQRDGLQLIVNPFESVKYTIQEISWTSFTNGDSGTNTYATSNNSFCEGQMTILEPLGVRFFNTLYNTYQQIGSTNGAMDAVWMIKTIFVGHVNVPTQGHPDYISNLKPLLIYPLDMKANFTEAGGRYDITFVSALNGGGHTRSTNSTAMTTASTVNLGGPNGKNETVTLQVALENLKQRTQELYEQNYQKIVTNQQQSGNTTLASTMPKKMQIDIKLDERLKEGIYIVKAPPTLSSGGNGSVPILNFKTNERFDQAIQKVLTLCEKVVELSTKGDAAGKKWMPVITTTQESLDPEQNNGIGSRTTFNIILREIYTIFDPKSGPEQTKTTNTATGTNTTIVENSGTSNTSAAATTLQQNAVDARNYLEYDYTYTGKNIDVLEYKMEMNYGMAFFQTLIAPSNVVNTGQVKPNDNVQSKASLPQGGASGVTTAVNPTVSSNGNAIHSTNPQGVSLYDDILRRQVQLETIASTIKIRGNPLLMDGMNVSRQDIESALAGKQPTGGLAGNWLNGPIVVKINVRMPSEDDPNTFEPFWYGGFYRVMSVRNEFAGGDFTQVLELLLIPDDSMSTPQDTTTPRPKGPSKAVEDTASIMASTQNTGDRRAIGTLSISENGLNFIKRWESFKDKKYIDVGKWAIGYGHNLTDQENRTGRIQLSDGQVVIVDQGITMQQADILIRDDVKRIAEKPLHNRISAPLYQSEYDALCSAVFNLGSGKILGSDSSVLKAVNGERYTEVPAALMLYNKYRVNGQLVENSGLTTRRSDEGRLWGSAA